MATGITDTGSLTTDVLKGSTQMTSLGRVSLAMTDADYTIAATDLRDSRRIEITGTLTADRNVLVAVRDGAEKVFKNGTTGGFNLTFKAVGQTGVVVAAGVAQILSCNATDWVKADG